MLSSSRRWILACASSLLLATSPSAAAPAAGSPPLNVSSTDWPPYFMEGEGFARALLETCIPAAGFTPRFSELPVDKIFVGLQDGSLDAHVMPRSADRERYVELGKEPLFRDGYRVVVRSGAVRDWQTLSDLDSLVLGYRDGLRYSPEFLQYVRTRRPGSVVHAATIEELHTLLQTGKIDAFVGLEGTVRWLGRRMGLEGKFVTLPRPVTDDNYYLALSRRSRKIADRQQVLGSFDDCLARLKASPGYNELHQQYDAASRSRRSGRQR